MKDKKTTKSRDVKVILGDSIIKDVKGWELTNDSNKVVVNFFPWSHHQSNEMACKTNYRAKSKKYHFTLRY